MLSQLVARPATSGSLGGAERSRSNWSFQNVVGVLAELALLVGALELVLPELLGLAPVLDLSVRGRPQGRLILVCLRLLPLDLGPAGQLGLLLLGLFQNNQSVIRRYHLAVLRSLI